jgi:hypothetical protein
MASNYTPTTAQCIQFLASHTRIIQAVHSNSQMPNPVTVGFVKLAEYLSAAIANVIFSTSILTYRHRNEHDKEVRTLIHNRMRWLLEKEVGQTLPENAGWCVENKGFLQYIVVSTL